MKLLTVMTMLSAASATLRFSYLDLSPRDTVIIGESYKISYLLDQPYELKLELVQKGTEPNVAWTPVTTLVSNVDGKPCNGSFDIKPDASWPTSDDGAQFAFWLDGTEYDNSGGYADLTDWFSIVDKGSEL